MEAIAAQLPVLDPRLRKRIAACGGLERGVKCGVEASDSGQIWQNLLQNIDEDESRRIVQWRQIVQFGQLCPDRGSITTGRVNRDPPWTTRWPMASIGPTDAGATQVVCKRVPWRFDVDRRGPHDRQLPQHGV